MTTANPLNIQVHDWVVPRQRLRMLDLCAEGPVDLEPGETLFVEKVDGDTLHVTGRNSALIDRCPLNMFAPAVLADLSPAELDATVVAEVYAESLEPGQTVIHGAQRYSSSTRSSS